MARITAAPSRVARAGQFTSINRICSAAVVGGFLDGITLEFRAGLNCLIGARGTGKTTVLELIRFALDLLPPADCAVNSRRRIESLVQENLKGGRVEVRVQTREGMTYRVTRAWGEDPIVLTEDGKATEITLKSGTLFQLDIYSQNEVESIADCPASQLKLLDSFEVERITILNRKIEQLLHELAGNSGAIIPLQERIAGLAEELTALPSLNDKLKAFASANTGGSDAVNKAHNLKSLRDREKRAVEGIGQYLQEFDGDLERQEGQIGGKIDALFCRDVGTGPNEELIGQIKRAIVDCASDVDAAVMAGRRRIAKLLDGLEDQATELTVRHNEQEMQFRALIEQHESAQGQAAERSRLEKARNDLLGKQRTRDELVSQLGGLQRKRTEMLGQLSTLRDERFRLRDSVAERISESLQGTVRVSVVQYGDAQAYQNLLGDALRTAKLKAGLMASRLAYAFWPSRLAEILRSGDTKALTSEAELTNEQARKIMDALATAAVLFDLETVELADLPKIELNNNGHYKESRALSTGQKCTTILPILMLDSDRPLLIDQPEDNLDNRYVFECIVRSIQQVKSRRQLVFLTHNPNIPVLGEAECVLVLDSDGRAARLARSGSVDDCKNDIVTLLEGGEEAFRQRLCGYAYA